MQASICACAMAKDPLKVNRAAFSVGRLNDAQEEKDYWLSRTPLERLEAIESMRQIIYGYDASTARLQRVLAIAQLEKS